MMCSIPGCDKAVHSRGWCNMHYMRWHRYGDPSIVMPPSGGGRPGIPRKENISYEGVHFRLGVVTGPCAICGAEALEWAYDHADPDEKISRRNRPYSLDLAHYFPVCRSCHRRFDAPVKTHCINGHELTPDNVYTTLGYRVCKQCHKQRTRRK